MRVCTGTITSGQKGQTRGSSSSCETDVREEVKETDKCFFTVQWRLNGDRGEGHGKSVSQVFDNKNLDLLKENDLGGGGKKLSKNWTDHEKTYNEFMWMNGWVTSGTSVCGGRTSRQ